MCACAPFLISSIGSECSKSGFGGSMKGHGCSHSFPSHYDQYSVHKVEVCLHGEFAVPFFTSTISFECSKSRFDCRVSLQPVRMLQRSWV